MGNSERLKIEEEIVSDDSPSGTTIEIYNILDIGKDRLTSTRVTNDMLS